VLVLIVFLCALAKKHLMVKAAKNQFGKQQTKTAKLGTENRRTHDATPKTQNPKQETPLLSRPNFHYFLSLPLVLLTEIGQEGNGSPFPTGPKFFLILFTNASLTQKF